ncbi:hypothetical protein QSJ18_10015 [Gordonia sp. ABSL1-1]|uniref:hypothetical protein n=1 Tax=Gordonia sp. ABSL1-1 TaxID=3053923 RepID=UPI00257249F7|nr:hypothetical protein [Gordonia sp. ABSL1-1]MDL9937076.1 hypothetical protein [Gordonia sp. ABSL1-1]
MDPPISGQRRRPVRGRGPTDPVPAPDLRRRRSAWNPASWSPAPSSIEPNRGYRPAGTPGGRAFASTEHLAPEAVAAFVDGELGMTAHGRAAHHLALCPECAGAVEEQAAARARLRDSAQVAIPASLLSQLAQIPTREIDLTAAQATTDRLDGARFPELPPNPFPTVTRGRMTRRWGR